jgi:uncharacterized Fe-S center protein
MKSIVYFARLSGSDPKQRLSALTRLLEASAGELKYRTDEIIPVKLTIGDSQCVHYVKPELVKVVISALKAKKTRPFLFDTSVIYKGERQNAVDHLTLANNKGFGHSRVGAPFIIADGLFGADGKEYQIKSDCVHKVKVPSFVGSSDSIVVLSHVTGHILSGFAAAIKNVAMGVCCRPTKQVQHSSVRPSVFSDKCTSCGCCIKICPVSAISWKERKAYIDKDKCVGCGECLCACKFDAISISFEEEVDIFCRRIADTAAFILSKFKNRFFINFAFDITKECDCISSKSDEVISRDIGILASSDIVSVDKATADLANKEKDVFLEAQGKPEYHAMFEYAARCGLGDIGYKLESV